ncbi:hypothetical protein [Levilactobacillus enshiensis]|uniref:hypothetical protein n=1 Tax=Levilactobacillus enshiensis TaxID=2590213 RepID=UPI001179DD43|nr:hypothetical protein [Levilactobacillus enshiensis]
MSLKTIRQIAEEQSVSKQTIRKQMDDEFRQLYVSKEGNKLLVSELGEKVLTARLSSSGDDAKKRNSKMQTGKSPVDVFHEQLAIKDQQISNLLKALNQSQQLQAQTQERLDSTNEQLQKLLKIASEERKLKTQIANGDKGTVTQQVSDEHKKWLARFFSSK